MKSNLLPKYNPDMYNKMYKNLKKENEDKKKVQDDKENEIREMWDSLIVILSGPDSDKFLKQMDDEQEERTNKIIKKEEERLKKEEDRKLLLRSILWNNVLWDKMIDMRFPPKNKIPDKYLYTLNNLIMGPYIFSIMKNIKDAEKEKIEKLIKKEARKLLFHNVLWNKISNTIFSSRKQISDKVNLYKLSNLIMSPDIYKIMKKIKNDETEMLEKIIKKKEPKSLLLTLVTGSNV